MKHLGWPIINEDNVEEIKELRDDLTTACRSVSTVKTVAAKYAEKRVGGSLAPWLDSINEAAESVPLGYALVDYLVCGGYVGGFLTSVLENNLVEAFNRADETNSFAMRTYAAWLWNELPTDAWKTRANIDAWQEKGGYIGAYLASMNEALEAFALEGVNESKENGFEVRPA